MSNTAAEFKTLLKRRETLRQVFKTRVIQMPFFYAFYDVILPKKEKYVQNAL